MGGEWRSTTGEALVSKQLRDLALSRIRWALGKRILLVEPDYYTRYPPLGLLKISSYHKSLGDKTKLVRGCVRPPWRPDMIYVTSLFTWAWKPVHDAVRHYKGLYPDVPVLLGGIYASLLPDHAKQSGADLVHVGIFEPAENFKPDYRLVPTWKSSVMFASRGCVRKCGFCSVPKLEGQLSHLKPSVKSLIRKGHKKVIFFDNNILAAENWRELFDELAELKVEVDFNQGMDARCVTDEVAERLARLNMPMIRLAYDYVGIKNSVEVAIKILKSHKISGRRMIFYVLHNYVDSPEDFFHKVRDLLNWGVLAYPMRYEPLCTIQKGLYVSPKWTIRELNMVSTARRVLGFGGALPPYKGLVKKFNEAENFHEAFSLRPVKKENRELPKEGLKEMALEHEILVPRSRKKNYFPTWRREENWRLISPGR
jgi:hypothetical protein